MLTGMGYRLVVRKSLWSSERLDGTDTQNHEFSLNIEHEFSNGMTLNLVTGVSE